MKALLVIAILVLVYLFYPQYDLLVRQSPFDEQATVEGSGYLTESRCQDEAKARHFRYYHCSGRTLWGKIVGTYTSYDPKERYAEKNM